MGTDIGVVIVAATLVSVFAAPPPPPNSPEPAMRVVVQTSGDAPDLRFAEALKERVNTAFPGVSDAARELLVRLEFGETLGVRVEELGDVWAHRTFERGSDNVQLLVSVWLFVRSSLARARLEGAPRAIEPLPPSYRVAAPPPPELAAQAKTKAPQTRLAALVTGAVVTSALWSLGLVLHASRAFGERTFCAGEVGYLVTPGTRRLMLHEVPLSGSFGVALPNAPHLDVGVLGVLRGKWAIAEETQGFALGVAAGPFVQVGRSSTGRSGMMLRAGMLWQAVRQRYLLDARTLREPSWTLSLAAGVLL